MTEQRRAILIELGKAKDQLFAAAREYDRAQGQEGQQDATEVLHVAARLYAKWQEKIEEVVKK